MKNNSFLIPSIGGYSVVYTLPKNLQASHLIKLFTLLAIILMAEVGHAQLEFASSSMSPIDAGPTITSQTATILYNTTGTTFAAYTPTTTVTVAYSNQQYTGADTESATNNALNFGQSTGAGVFKLMNSFGAPSSGSFTSNPFSGTGTGIDVAQNYGFAMVTGTEQFETLLPSTASTNRIYMGDMTLTFNRPVNYPVIHIVGIGGSIGSLGYSTEFDFVPGTVGESLALLSGSTNFNVTATQINNGNSPMGANCGTGGACGSVKVNATNVTTLSFKVYLRPDGNVGTWPTSAAYSSDAYTLSVSLAPILTISGNIYNDTNALTDNTVNGTGTNISNALYAVLVDGNGNVYATTPVAAGGTYSFSNVLAANYTLRLCTSAGTVGNPAPAASLPSGWVNTGENIGSGTGNDGSANGAISIVGSTSTITNVNFGVGCLGRTITGTEASCTSNDDKILANATVNMSVNGTGTFTWNNSLGTGSSKTVNPIMNTTYTVTVTENGCTVIASKTIYIDSDCDGINDMADIDDDNDGVLDTSEKLVCNSTNENSTAGTGSGAYKGNLYWFNWTGAAFADGLHNGDSQTFTLTDGTIVTATVSNVVNIAGGGGPSYVAGDMNTWSGSYIHQLYNTTGVQEALYSAEAADVSFNISFSSTKSGNPVRLNLVFVDAEATANGSESISASTNGGNWQTLETIGDGGNISGIGTNALSFVSTEAGNRVFYSEDASTISVNINAGGREGVAFGLLLNCDTDGDGIANYLDTDSDGDGCSDAYESGAIAVVNANYQFTGAVGANGLVDSKETSTDSGTINYSATYSNATNSTIKTCCPTASIASTESSCTANDDKVLSSASVNLTASGGTIFAWSTSESLASITKSPMTTTTYTVTVSNASGCAPATASKTIQVVSAPTASILATESSCTANDDKVLSSGSVSMTASGGTSYLWSTSESTAGITKSPITTTTYTVTVSNTSGCASATASKTIEVVSAPTASILATESSCTANDDKVLSSASVNLTASGGTIFAWSTSESLASITKSPMTTTTYTVTVSNASGCAPATASKTIQVVSAPTASILATESSCTANDDKVLSSGSVSMTASGGTSYLWSTSESTAGITKSPMTTTTYTVTVSNTSGCASATASKTIEVVSAPTASILATESSCTANDDKVLSSGSVSMTASGGTSYSWSTGELVAGITKNPTLTTTYTVTVSNTSGCASATASKTITIEVLPFVNAIANQIVCDGSATTLITFSGNATTYSWSNSNTSIGLGASGSGNIPSFSVINGGGSPITGTITVTPSSATCTGSQRTFDITAYNNPNAPSLVKRN